MRKPYMKTTQETKAGTYRMWRSRGSVIVSLEPKIGGKDFVGWKHTVGTMTPRGDGNWYATKVKLHRWNNAGGAWERHAEDDEFYASSTPSALKEFVCLYDEFFIRTLLEYEGEVFNPITQETRIHYGSIGNDEPLQETWIRISDDEDALARIWNDEFKKLAGAVVPVKQWDNHDDHTRRPQNNIWAVIDREHTAPLGMTTGVGLPPRLWEIIDIDKEYTFSDEQMSSLEPEPAVEHDEMWNSIGYTISFDSFEFNPNAESNEDYYDMNCLELLQEGLMKALFDVQRRISQQARDDVKEASQ